MQNIIIGTAGHIDHGKTTLIKAMTGRETDSLKEEKERGISIDLGFTYFDLPSGRRAGIVDVPGHERFIKNMLAGVGGIDIVILVIAADEGIMPQTREHLNILNLLEVKTGIIALTKCDMVDGEWLEMIKEEIMEGISNTFLKNASILPVSSTKNLGIEELIKQIDQLTIKVKNKDLTKPFRLPIDRVFTIKGFGRVATGTLIEGCLKQEDTIMIYPDGNQAKARNIQVHNNTVDHAEAGQRVAVNISGLKKQQLSRGDVLAAVNSLQPTMMVDCKVMVLPDSPFAIRNRERVHIYHGTSEILARIILLNQEELLPGEQGYAQLRLEEESMVKPKDRLIIRFYSPMVTIGGAVVLDSNPPKRKRFIGEVIKELKLKEAANPKDILLQFLKVHSMDFITKDEIHKKTGISLKDIEESHKALIEEKSIVDFKISGEVYLLHIDLMNQITHDIKAYLQAFHKNNPLKAGVSKEEIRSKFFTKMKAKIAEELLRFIENNGTIKIQEEIIALKNFNIKLTEKQRQIAQFIEKTFIKDCFNPPKFEKIVQDKVKERKEYHQVFQALIDWGTLIKISEEIYFHKTSYHHAIEKLNEYFKSNPEINVAQFRDLLGTSRRFAIALLENFDQKKITKRKEDIRVLY